MEPTLHFKVELTTTWGMHRYARMVISEARHAGLYVDYYENDGGRITRNHWFRFDGPPLDLLTFRKRLIESNPGGVAHATLEEG